MDETYVGGKLRGNDAARRRLTNKETVIGIKQRGGDLRFFHAADAKSGTLAKYIKENISEEVEVIMTDEWNAYNGVITLAGFEKDIHKTVNHHSGSLR